VPLMEIWKFNRQMRSVPAGGVLRIQANSPFRLHWSNDQWNQTQVTDSTALDTGHEYADIRVSPGQRAPICFTFFWRNAARWEGRDFQVAVEARGTAVPAAAPRRSRLCDELSRDGAALVVSGSS